MLKVDYKIDEVIRVLNYSYEEFKKLTFRIASYKSEGKKVLYVIIDVNDNEPLEMGNGVVIIMESDNIVEIKKELLKYSKAIKKTFSVESKYKIA